jgi:hypothetical protein
MIEHRDIFDIFLMSLAQKGEQQSTPKAGVLRCTAQMFEQICTRHGRAQGGSFGRETWSIKHLYE